MIFSLAFRKDRTGKAFIASLALAIFFTFIGLISFINYEQFEDRLESANSHIHIDLITIGKVAELEEERKNLFNLSIVEKNAGRVEKIADLDSQIMHSIEDLYLSANANENLKLTFLQKENQNLLNKQIFALKLVADGKFGEATKLVGSQEFSQAHRNFIAAVDSYRDQLNVEIQRLQKQFSRYRFIQRIIGLLTFFSWMGILLYLFVILSASNRLLTKTIDRMEYILDGAGLGSWDWWLETNAVLFDKRWLEMVGLREGEAPMDLSTWESRVHPDDLAKCYADIKAYLNGETPVYENIHRMRHSDGSWIWILDRGRISERAENGKPVRFTGTHFEISQYKKAEFLSEEIQSLAKIGGWELNLATQESKWTDQTYRIHGVAKDTPATRDMAINFYSPHERARITDCMQKCMDGVEYKEVFEFCDAQGSYKWVEATGKPVYDADGKVVALRGSLQDISERVEVSARLDRLIQNTPGMIYQFKMEASGQTSFTYVSDKGFDIYELTQKEMSANPNIMLEMVQSEFQADIEKRILESATNLIPFIWEGKIKTSSGKIKWISAHSTPRRESDGATIWDGLVVDITDRKALELSLEQERSKALMSARLASLGEMSAGIAHEINNPLALISGTLALLNKYKDDPEKFQNKLLVIKKANERIAKIVKGLKKFSRTSEGREHSWHFIAEIASEAFQMTEAKAIRHGVTIASEVCGTCKIYCDQVEVEQVLTNLINNGIEAVANLEKPWVKVQAHEDGPQVIIRVIDSGNGVSSELEQKIFDPFFTTKPVGVGTGLGLSISRGILEQHNATIALNRNYSTTCFEIIFPKVFSKETA